jgi:hypothetical protein
MVPQSADQALGKLKTPAPGPSVALPRGLPALELVSSRDLGFALGLHGSARCV